MDDHVITVCFTYAVTKYGVIKEHNFLIACEAIQISSKIVVMPQRLKVNNHKRQYLTANVTTIRPNNLWIFVLTVYES